MNLEQPLESQCHDFVHFHDPRIIKGGKECRIKLFIKVPRKHTHIASKEKYDKHITKLFKSKIEKRNQ